jgi:hypothetical protein
VILSRYFPLDRNGNVCAICHRCRVFQMTADHGNPQPGMNAMLTSKNK